MGVKAEPHLSRESEPDEASRCSKGTGGLAPPVRSRTETASSIRGERSSGTARLGLMLQLRVAV